MDKTPCLKGNDSKATFDVNVSECQWSEVRPDDVVTMQGLQGSGSLQARCTTMA